MINTGETIDHTDFINQSERDATPANDAGRVPKLESDGKIHRDFLPVKFGGDGSDGALAVSSGNTNIDLGGASFFVKNYSSISITGTGSITFINPHANGTVIVIKCKGDCSLTSSATPMIDASGCGGNGGGGGTEPDTSDTNHGSNGSNGITPVLTTVAGQGSSTATAGTKPTSFLFSITYISNQLLKWKYPYMWTGSGGGGGSALHGGSAGGTVLGGIGGKGGGSLIMEVGGAWNFTTTNGISVAGKNGNVGSGTTASYLAGGGGGGGGGQFLAFVNSIIANTGTINKSGGIGANSFGNYSITYGGGGGASGINNGNNGGASANGAKSGGDGGVGDSLVSLNTEFV